MSMDNSDNDQRKFDITCDVALNSEGESKVNSVSVSKNGVGAANVHFSNYSQENPNVSFNFFNLPMTEHAECIEAVYAFVEQALAEVKAGTGNE